MFNYWIWYWTWWIKVCAPQPTKTKVIRPRFNRVPRKWHREKAPVIPLKRVA